MHILLAPLAPILLEGDSATFMAILEFPLKIPNRRESVALMAMQLRPCYDLGDGVTLSLRFYMYVSLGFKHMYIHIFEVFV